MDTERYTPPVSQLLTYGDCRKLGKQWPNYVQELGLTTDHIPQLIQLMTDEALWVADSDSLEVWSTAHAWRALAQLKAIAAIEPLLALFADHEEDDYLNEETPQVLAMMGPEALPNLPPHLENRHLSEWAKVAIALGIRKIGEQHPDSQPACIELLHHQLQTYRTNSDALNGWLVDGLVAFKALDSAALIEEVYAKGDIDDMCAGTWPRVQVDLGLKQESEFNRKDFVPAFARTMRESLFGSGPSRASDSTLPLDLSALQGGGPPKFGTGSLKAPQGFAKKTQGFAQGTGKKAKKK
ncbi:MAG: hypothetical protein HC812_11885 [Leptolyngbya sp. RL_3_1]|nr:hypothetical protein [Leptolyngbya sp. RL_3_1]